MLKIEILYPEVANLFGDLFNIKFLEKSIKESYAGAGTDAGIGVGAGTVADAGENADDVVGVINTSLKETPRFIEGDIDLVYMGPMPEYAQELAIDALRPHAEAIKSLIDAGKVFLFTGNAFEIFSEYIEKDDGSRIDGLGIFPGHAVRRMMARYNSLYLGKLDSENMDIIGFKSQFSKMYDVPLDIKAFHTIRECEAEDTAVDEGVRIKNFFGTYLLGPFLIVCPNFTKYLISLMGIEEPKLAYEDYTMYCYEERMKDFLDPSKDFH